MFERLIEILQAQLSLYEELLESSSQKRTFLTNSDIDAIRKVTACENSLIGKLQKLEREREALTADIAGRIRISVNNLTLVRLIGHIDDPPTRKHLDKLRIRLRARMDELKSVNEQNKALINQSLEYIDFNMNLLRSSVSGPVYAGAEEIHGQVFFDARG